MKYPKTGCCSSGGGDVEELHRWSIELHAAATISGYVARKKVTMNAAYLQSALLCSLKSKPIEMRCMCTLYSNLCINCKGSCPTSTSRLSKTVNACFRYLSENELLEGGQIQLPPSATPVVVTSVAGGSGHQGQRSYYVWKEPPTALPPAYDQYGNQVGRSFYLKFSIENDRYDMII